MHIYEGAVQVQLNQLWVVFSFKKVILVKGQHI